MKNLLASALVALLVSIAASSADQPLPVERPYSPPSAADVNKAQTRAINDLKNTVAMLKLNQAQLLNAYNAQAGDLDTLFANVNCLNGYEEDC